MERNSLQDKKFKSISSTTNAEVGADTIFHYRQKDNIIWATYEGGAVLFGTLSGRLENDTLEFTYQHQNLEGEFMTGICTSKLEVQDGKITLHEVWQWTCGDHSKGTSVVQEI